MMSRYNQPPEIRGRFMSPFLQSKEKRHYWGLKGKNYGFYTTNDEIDMEERRRQYRRLKSDYSNYMTIPHQASEPVEDGRPTVARLRTEPVSDSANKVLNKPQSPTQQANPEWRDITVQQKMKNQRIQQKKKHLNISLNNVEINLKPRNIVLPEIKRNSTVEECGSIDQRMNLKGKVRAELNKDGNVVYYAKRDRSLNPTYCNSLGYPLPCYRYVG